MPQAHSAICHVAKQSSPSNRARGAVIESFLDALLRDQQLSCANVGSPLAVAVVGGSLDEPEIIAMRKLGLRVTVETFGLEGSMHELDLNQPVKTGAARAKYDLVLCSQVLEHVWNHEAFFDHLRHLAAGRALLWLSCPSSNRRHGSPDFFSAGFTSDYLARNLQSRGASIVAMGEVGSQRLYYGNHIADSWLDYRSHRNPMMRYISDPGPPMPRRLITWTRRLPQSLLLCLLSPRIATGGRWVTESWVGARWSPEIT